MEFYPTVAREIEVAHEDVRCGLSPHGHRMTVAVTVRGTYDAQLGYSSGADGLGEAMDAVLGEVHLRPLNVIAPAQATPEGLGLWLIERLLPGFPKIVEVKVWRDPLHSYSIKREPR